MGPCIGSFAYFCQQTPCPMAGTIFSERKGWKSYNYHVEMHDRRKKLRLFHVNMLKQWHAPAAAYWTAIDSHDSDDNDDVPVWKNNPNDTKLTFGQQLSQTQREDLQHLLCDYQEVMTAC